MFCTGCGSEVPDTTSFCAKCGQAQHPAAGQAAPSEGPAPRLVRITSEKKIAGVCAGVGRYLGIDPTLVRIVWLILFFAWGTGGLAYIIAWIAMPEEQRSFAAPTTT